MKRAKYDGARPAVSVPGIGKFLRGKYHEITDEQWEVLSKVTEGGKKAFSQRDIRPITKNKGKKGGKLND